MLLRVGLKKIETHAPRSSMNEENRDKRFFYLKGMCKLACTWLTKFPVRPFSLKGFSNIYYSYKPVRSMKLLLADHESVTIHDPESINHFVNEVYV